MLKNHQKTDGWLVVWVLTFALALTFSTCIKAHAQDWSREVSLTWHANTETDMLEYRVYENGEQVGTVPFGTEAYTRTITTPGSYTYYLTAVDQSLNESDPSSTVGVVLDGTSPTAPTQIQITISIGITQ